MNTHFQTDTHSATCDLFSLKLDYAETYLQHCTPDQKYWLLFRSIADFAEHLEHLNSSDYTGSGRRTTLLGQTHDQTPELDERELIIADQEVMQSWEAPLMKKMADAVAFKGADLLEIGFGMGISARYMLEQKPRSYTVVEANVKVAEGIAPLQQRYPDTEIVVKQGRWQDALTGCTTKFDGIFFDTYPESENDWYENALKKSCYAENFFAQASRLLKSGGVFTYYTGEVDHLGRRHQRKLLEYFDRFDMEICTGLKPAEDCTYWWNDRMVVVGAHKS